MGCQQQQKLFRSHKVLGPRSCLGLSQAKARLSPWDPEQGKRKRGEAPVQSCTTHMLRHVLQGVLDLSPEEIG